MRRRLKPPKDPQGEQQILLFFICVLLLGLFALYGEQAEIYLREHRGQFYQDRR
jgi:hypothetical protein